MKCAIGKLGVSKIECLHLHRWSRNGPRCGCSVLGLLGPLWARWLWRAPPAGSCGGYCCLLWLLVADVGPVPHGRSRRKLRSLQSPPRSLCLQSRNGPLSPSKQCQRGSLHFWKWPQTGLVCFNSLKASPFCIRVPQGFREHSQTLVPSLSSPMLPPVLQHCAVLGWFSFHMKQRSCYPSRGYLPILG